MKELYGPLSAILLEHLQKAQQDIIHNYDRSGMRAGGGFERGLKFDVTENIGLINAKLTGVGYSRFVNDGREPTKPNAPKSNPPLVDLIKEWIRVKGLDLNAYAVTKNIHKKGWQPRSLQKLQVILY